MVGLHSERLCAVVVRKLEDAWPGGSGQAVGEWRWVRSKGVENPHGWDGVLFFF